MLVRVHRDQNLTLLRFLRGFPHHRPHRQYHTLYFLILRLQRYLALLCRFHPGQRLCLFGLHHLIPHCLRE